MFRDGQPTRPTFTNEHMWWAFFLGVVTSLLVVAVIVNVTDDPPGAPPAPQCVDDEVAIHDTGATNGDYTGVEFNTICIPFDELLEQETP